QDDSGTLDCASGNIVFSWGPSVAGSQGGPDPSRSAPINLAPLAAHMKELQAAQDDLQQAISDDDDSAIADARSRIDAANSDIGAAKTAIETAINNIPNIAHANGHVVVTGASVTGSLWTIDLEFRGGLADHNVPSP